jgi:hypothetical protein
MWDAAALTDRGLGITPVCTFRCGCRDHRLDSGKTSTQVRFTVCFCSPALRFHATSPCRHCRHCGAPKPRKEKQKSYDYRSAILIVHRFRSSLSVFTQVLRKIRREVTRKMARQGKSKGFSGNHGLHGSRGCGLKDGQFADVCQRNAIFEQLLADYPRNPLCLISLRG